MRAGWDVAGKELDMDTGQILPQMMRNRSSHRPDVSGLGREQRQEAAMAKEKSARLTESCENVTTESPKLNRLVVSFLFYFNRRILIQTQEGRERLLGAIFSGGLTRV